MTTEETTLDRIRTRPRFKMFTHLTKEEYAQNLKKYLAEHKKNFPATSIRRLLPSGWKQNMTITGNPVLLYVLK